MESSELRDRILQNLKYEKEFFGMVNANINGYYFSAADIALPTPNGTLIVFRIAVIKHKQTIAVT